MYIFLGQIGLGNLTEAEKQSFIAFLNDDLEREGAGKIEPIKKGDIAKNGLPPVVGDAADLIEIAGFLYVSTKLAYKKLPYFYERSMSWLKSKNKDTSHMAQVKKMVDFTQEAGDGQREKTTTRR